MTVSERVGGDAGHEVEVAVPLGIEDGSALAAFNYNWDAPGGLEVDGGLALLPAQAFGAGGGILGRRCHVMLLCDQLCTLTAVLGSVKGVGWATLPVCRQDSATAAAPPGVAPLAGRSRQSPPLAGVLAPGRRRPLPHGSARARRPATPLPVWARAAAPSPRRLRA